MNAQVHPTSPFVPPQVRRRIPVHVPEASHRLLVKECWERAAALVALVVLAPLLLAIVVWVRLDSSGPAIFRQRRAGQRNVEFTMLKFRTMTTDAEDRKGDLVTLNEANGVLFKIQGDPRVTRAGRLLRKYSLDELPQLINIARGEMSLVGPRPPLPDEVARYDARTARRLVVKPGLTGLWQVSGRSDLSWEESVRLDLRYVDERSARLDAVILARTVGAVLTHRGAY
ncbi:sugar transferase [Nocardioides sp.]|uniref:sugar transferase n=1 Tax=Nocardioides sp. TaxID=35761 RepID=UPI00273464FD|nr:sugar transferase [Nocardioides sp.]MDP3891174.1 sugar transferase [Nocardioides sp.]